MSDATFAKVTAQKAIEVCQRYYVDDDVQELLTDTQTPKQFLDALTDQQRYMDACRFLAQALPPREAIWWGLQCARQAPSPKAPEKAAAALQLVEKWVLDPQAEVCQQAMDAAEATGAMGTAAGSATMAVFFCGNSMAPPDLAPVPPPPHLPGVAVANAVTLAAYQGDPTKAPEKFQEFIALGVEVANGTNSWPAPAPPPAAAPRPAARPTPAAPTRPRP